ncbi:hypothetical protein FOZ62_025333 [Perkinsus olseni]|uniref:Uncharacterized protein n=1 Tax=Perkinsus olseni TaxID=32597 RepID=A0A7J6RBF6_PEROL|nr:hypothetical protein FOZ62_025333 [Perkinsus olseni]
MSSSSAEDQGATNIPLGNASLDTGDSSERFIAEEMRGYDYEKPLINNAGGYACEVNERSWQPQASDLTLVICSQNNDCQMGASCMHVAGVGQYACLYLA